MKNTQDMMTVGGREYPVAFVLDQGVKNILSRAKASQTITQARRDCARRVAQMTKQKRAWEREQEKDEQNNMEQGKRRRAKA